MGQANAMAVNPYISGQLKGREALNKIIDDYQVNLEKLYTIIDGLTDDQMDWKLIIPLGDDYWSVRQILAHIEEVNSFWVGKLHRLIADPQNVSAERNEEELEARQKAVDEAYDKEIQAIMDGIKTSAQAAIDDLKTLTDEELAVTTEPAPGVKLPITFLIDHVYADHIDMHIKHIERQLFAYSQYH